jgi:imidazolonepropionase-like amidohydrolase
LRRTREQLHAGVSQIKIAAGGGVASYYDPLDSIQFRPEEIRAAVGAAADWGTYVTAHVYTSSAVRRCIEHGHLIDEDTVRFLVDKDLWWCLQLFTADLVQISFPGAVRQAKLTSVYEGTDSAYKYAIKHKAKVGWGTDILFSPTAAARQGKMVAGMTRWHGAAEALKMATADNAALLSLSLYQGKFGVIEKGALADIPVIDGDPKTDLGVIADPERNLRIIMKDGALD